MQAANFSLPKYSGYLILGLLLAFYLVNGINYLRHQSVTSDEASFMGYAIRYLKGEPERVYPRTDNSKMPVIVLNMLPRIAEEKLGGPKEKTDWGLSDTMNGRYMTLLLSIFTILLVYGWSRQLYGEAAGLFSTFLMVCCPNNLANAALVTTDSYSVLFLLLCMYLLWQFCKTRRSLDFILLAIAVAMAQLVKQSLFHLYILVPLCLLIHGLVYKEKFKVGLFIKRLLLFIGCSVLIINIGYYFNGSFTRLSEYNFMSNLFMGVQNVFPGSLPLPFPKPFVDGLDMAKYYDQLGGGIDNVSSFGKVTILGQSRTGDGFWYYYLVSLFYKTPIAYLIFFVWSVWLLIKRFPGKSFFSNEFFLLVPVIYFLVLMSFFYQTQCGLRHLIFIYPFLFIFSGSIMNYLETFWLKAFLVASSLFLLVSIGRYWGNYFPYTNEFAWDKKMAWNKVGSANLEFHQGYYFAEDYLESHPEVSWAPKTPSSGRFLITTEDYEDIWNRNEFDWIQSYEPVGHVAYNFLIIEVP